MRAVLWDMDGTLVDSEKLWDVAINEFYARRGRVLAPEIRDATVGGSAEGVIRIVFEDLGLDPDPEHMAEVADWIHDYVGELFTTTGLPWCPGARELLDILLAADVPMALVTNTRRALTENALNSIGRHYFSATVCGDEVPEGKPAPDIYLRAADLLGLAATECLAIEDSVTGTAAAEAAGCPVLVVPNEVAVPATAGRHQVSSLTDLGIPQLRQIYADLRLGFGERSA
ncbi:HAD family phosphatase [Mycobacterium sp. shizuoka-1]|uniref:HAD family hydrolase n=1 Tax=Mycobacterium sp. shizuoka-1 TaxID=2039281 RepID=UPI000C07A198|nr:HAD family hydrolase [Mycobacterium sp. shizuoka-1]